MFILLLSNMPSAEIERRRRYFYAESLPTAQEPPAIPAPSEPAASPHD